MTELDCSYFTFNFVVFILHKNNSTKNCIVLYCVGIHTSVNNIGENYIGEK